MTSGSMVDRRPASKLRLTRVAKGWRIGELAKALDVAESSIRRIEIGEIKEPSDRMRRKLSAKLRVSQAALFGKVRP